MVFIKQSLLWKKDKNNQSPKIIWNDYRFVVFSKKIYFGFIFFVLVPISKIMTHLYLIYSKNKTRFKLSFIFGSLKVVKILNISWPQGLSILVMDSWYVTTYQRNTILRGSYNQLTLSRFREIKWHISTSYETKDSRKLLCYCVLYCQCKY